MKNIARELNADPIHGQLGPHVGAAVTNPYTFHPLGLSVYLTMSGRYANGLLSNGIAVGAWGVYRSITNDVGDKICKETNIVS